MSIADQIAQIEGSIETLEAVRDITDPDRLPEGVKPADFDEMIGHYRDQIRLLHKMQDLVKEMDL